MKPSQGDEGKAQRNVTGPDGAEWVVMLGIRDGLKVLLFESEDAAITCERYPRGWRHLPDDALIALISGER